MAEDQYLVLSALGPDRPGLVADTTRFLMDHGLNVEDSRAVVLGGEFGLMILASGPDTAVRGSIAEISRLEQATELHFLYRPTVSPEQHRKDHALPYRVEANAMDHEGIVQAVTNALYQAGINIVALETEVREAPVTGTPLFSLVAQVDLPATVSADAVRKSLSEIGAAHNLDIDFRPDR